MSLPCILVDINAICNIAASNAEKLCLNKILTDSLAQYSEREISIIFLIPQENIRFVDNEIYYYKNVRDKTDPIKLSPFLNQEDIRTYHNHLDKKVIIDDIANACADLNDSNFIFLTADHELMTLAQKKEWIANKIYWEGELEINDRIALEKKLSVEMTTREIVQVFDVDGTIFLEKESDKQKATVNNQALVNNVNFIKDKGFKNLVNRVLSTRNDPVKSVQEKCEEYKKQMQKFPDELQQIKFEYSSQDIKKTFEKIIGLLSSTKEPSLESYIELFQQLYLQWIEIQDDYSETFPVLEKFSEMINLPLTLDQDSFTNGKPEKSNPLETLIRKNPKAFYIFYENDVKYLLPAGKLADKLGAEGIHLHVVRSMEENHYVEWLENVVNSYLESSDESEGYDSEPDESGEINEETGESISVVAEKKDLRSKDRTQEIVKKWVSFMQNLQNSRKSTFNVSANTEQNEANEANVDPITKSI